MKKDTKDKLRAVFLKLINWIKSILVLAFLVFAWLIYSNYDKKQTSATSDSFPSFNWECSGKTTCSEMNSCEEAKFYMLNCPNTDLDPDGDGKPCESSVCANN